MKSVFVDTSFLVGLALKDDELHEGATAWNRRASRQRVTTEYVLVEVGDTLSPEHTRPIAAEIIRGLRSSLRVKVIPSSEALLLKGLALFESRRDKNWGLTDCISFAVMNDLGLEDALTSDRHFEQAGFRALLRMPVDPA